ncbi:MULTISPECIES: TetR/AcrR family transcriptional regulator [unclassified Beijerinckia]|uniref:TetR/AcrR family transcriptional regulator n=1 Tax=unclassified Beijerinckia TaxID=2638183 RepID=UPI00089428AA|nr:MULTISPECIES: TetR/AcrR family transcriptional regulator [unclassified Beijerinckia]MDH7795936.1 AcrR family transcriptional regulator [Beijerinckia sp. GAS462]SEC22937.1 transcriptional regulator, TetR family [Beijerinckia sp. 28-YEA-48]
MPRNAKPENSLPQNSSPAASAAVPASKALLRQSILTAASRLFATNGFAGTSLQNIADEIGVTRPALYYYFRSKDEILSSLVEDITIGALKRSAQIGARSGEAPTASLHQMVMAQARWIMQHPVEFRVLLRTENYLSDKARAVQDTAKRGILTAFARVIEAGVAKGEFRPVDPHMAALAILGMCNWSAFWFSDDGRKSADDIANIMAEMAVNSIRRSRENGKDVLSLASLLTQWREDIDIFEKVAAKP